MKYVNPEKPTVRVDGVEMPAEVTIQRDSIEVPPSMYPEPDPDWTYIDEQGHEHYRADTSPHYPTLMRVVDEVYWCHDCRDEHERSHLECRQCGEHIEPGTKPPSPFPTYVPGTIDMRFVVDELEASHGDEVTVEFRSDTFRAIVADVETEIRSGVAPYRRTHLQVLGEVSASR